MNFLENEFLKLTFQAKGGELKSVFHKKINKELLYDGKDSFWNRSSPILFPIVGKLKENVYTFDDRKFTLNQHGFARDMEFSSKRLSENTLEFYLKENEKTLSFYPFKFELKIIYELKAQAVSCTYQVFNTDSKDLLFALGAHPGFTCPVFENEKFEDYFLEFEFEESQNRHLLDVQTGLFNFKEEQIIANSRILDLEYKLFDSDAIVFKELKSTWVKLKSRKNNYTLKFNFENFPHFGIWTKNNAPFICLEPWCGYADNLNSMQKLEEKEAITSLPPKETFSRTFSFEVEY
jgi:galactose mutarotase-like enzyme